MSDVTQILKAVEQGDANAAGQLIPAVYEELRRLATHKMNQEAPGQTLQPTALVHEAWLRLTGNEEVKWEGRAHFFGDAAHSHRQRPPQTRRASWRRTAAGGSSGNRGGHRDVEGRRIAGDR